MQAKRLGELLLIQVMTTWDERELEHCESGRVYFLAQLLRGAHFSGQEVGLNGNEASMAEVADAIEKLDFTAVPTYWKHIVMSGIGILRNPTTRPDLLHAHLNLTAEYAPDKYFPSPLEA